MASAEGVASAAGLLAAGDAAAASPLPGGCASEELVPLAGDDAPDDPDTAGLVVAGAVVAGAVVAGAVVAGAFVAGAFVAGAVVAGFWTGDSVSGVAAGSSDAEADAGSAGLVVGGVGPVHSLFSIR